jgi:hypothetical protein
LIPGTTWTRPGWALRRPSGPFCLRPPHTTRHDDEVPSPRCRRRGAATWRTLQGNLPQVVGWSQRLSVCKAANHVNKRKASFFDSHRRSSLVGAKKRAPLEIGWVACEKSRRRRRKSIHASRKTLAKRQNYAENERSCCCQCVSAVWRTCGRKVVARFAFVLRRTIIDKLKKASASKLTKGDRGNTFCIEFPLRSFFRQASR